MSHKTRHHINEVLAHSYAGLADGDVVVYSGGNLVPSGIKASTLEALARFAHRRNLDTKLDEGGTNEVTAQQLKTAVALAGAVVDVGVGQTYTTVGAAVTAGKRRVRLVSDVTETADITFAYGDHLEVHIGVGYAWHLSQYKLLALTGFTLEGSGYDGFLGSRVTYTPIANNHNPVVSTYVNIRNVSILNNQAIAYNDTFFCATSDFVLQGVLFSDVGAAAGARTLWYSIPSRTALMLDVRFSCSSADALYLDSSGPGYRTYWYGGYIDASVPATRGALLKSVEMVSVGIRSENATASIDFEDCYVAGVYEHAPFLGTTGTINFDGCDVEGFQLPTANVVFQTTACKASKMNCGDLAINIGGSYSDIDVVKDFSLTATAHCRGIYAGNGLAATAQVTASDCKLDQCVFNALSIFFSITGSDNVFVDCEFNNNIDGTTLGNKNQFVACKFNGTTSPQEVDSTDNKFTDCTFLGVSVQIDGSRNSFIGCVAGDPAAPGSTPTFDVTATADQTVLLACRTDAAITDAGTNTQQSINTVF